MNLKVFLTGRAAIISCVRHPIAPSFLHQNETVIDTGALAEILSSPGVPYFYETFRSSEVHSNPHD
jgi:hypothetical protein